MGEAVIAFYLVGAGMFALGVGAAMGKGDLPDPLGPALGAVAAALWPLAILYLIAHNRAARKWAAKS